MKVLCYDIGGTNVKYGVVEDQKILEKNSFKTYFKNGREDLTARILKVAHELVDKYPDIKGVGISCAGSINYDKGMMVTPPASIPEFGDWNFQKIFHDEFGFNVVADNDVNCFASCECKMGAGKKYKTYLVMTIGTGIGGAIVVNNTVWRGNNYNAGEIGRMLINGIHWEELGSMTALIKAARLRGLDVKEGKEVFDLYDSGNPVATIVISEFYQNLGRGIANLVYIFNPEALIIGGGISARKGFGAEINAYANYFLVEGFQSIVDIIPAQYQNDGGILGSYCNFVEKYGGK